MRIGFVTQPGHAVLPASGSVELWADAVATRLAERHDVTIYASRPPRLARTPGGAVTYKLAPHAGRLLIRALRRSWRVFSADRPFFASVFHPIEYWIRVALDVRRARLDVVHVFNYSQALPFLGKLTDAKLVIHMHCEWLSQLDSRMIERRLRHADLIVGCSDYITDKVRQRFPQHAARCTTIYNGVEAVPRRASGDAHDDGVIRLLNVGRVSPEKGLHVLVDALEHVVAVNPDVRVTVLGEESPVPYEFAVKISEDELVKKLSRFYGGSYLSQLRERMSDTVAARVTFVDRVAHDQTRRFYEDADIFVFPSVFEAFPIPPIEAMAAGLPVIASKAGGVVESIVDGETGFLVEREDPAGLADAIIRLANSEQMRVSMGEAGRARVREQYPWSRIVSDLETAFLRLLGPAAEPVASPEVVELD